MLHFLSSLFTSPADRSGGLDEALVEKAIERAVVGTDRRLHALTDYRKRLRQPVEQTIHHVISLVDGLPAPVPISSQAYSDDHKLRALFASVEHLREVCGGFNTVRDYLAGLSSPPPEEIFGLLTTSKEERNVFGMELEGDTLRRDVMQVAVNFFNHRYLTPSDNELDARWELKKRAFDFLVEKALEHLANERGKRRELDRQRQLLRRKLDAMRAGQWGLGSMLDDGASQRPNLAALEAEIQAIEKELGHSHSDRLGLEESLGLVAEILSYPQDWLAAREVSLCLDYRGIKLAEPSSAGYEITLTELYSGTGEQRTAMLARIARADIPEPADFWKTAKHYL